MHEIRLKVYKKVEAGGRKIECRMREGSRDGPELIMRDGRIIKEGRGVERRPKTDRGLLEQPLYLQYNLFFLVSKLKRI